MKLKVEALNAKVYDVLKENILTKKFEPGMQLIEAKLSEMYGISRTPVREALFKLQKEGLVTKTGKSYHVCKFTKKDISEVYELRKMMDVYAAKKVIKEIIDVMPEAEKIIDEAYNGERIDADGVEFISADESFHGCIAALTGNSRLIEDYSILRDQMRAFRAITSQKAERRGKAKDYHSKIYEAFKKRDVDAVEKAIEQHTQYSMEDALSDFTDDE